MNKICRIKLFTYRLICFICVFVLCAPCAFAETDSEMSGKTASVYGYALNDEIVRYGVISKEHNGSVIYSSENGFPSGVIYADTVKFERKREPCLVVFRSDGSEGCMCADVFSYDDDTGKAVPTATLVKFFSEDSDVDAMFSLGENGAERYIIYTEYRDNVLVSSEYYTIINDTAFRYVTAPNYSETKDIVRFGYDSITPKTDLGDYNRPLDDFFSSLKNTAADSVTYGEVLERLSVSETTELETLLKRAAQYKFFDINQYDTMEEYNAALAKPDTDNVFYSITELYDLGDEIYYARFATNDAFYNYAVLRRSDEAENGYQILSVRTDSIPLSDAELRVFKNECMHNKLLLKKAKSDNIEQSESSGIRKLLNIPKILNVPKILPGKYRFPAACIGGGLSLVLFVMLWAVMSSSDEDSDKTVGNV